MDDRLKVSEVYISIVEGRLGRIESKETVEAKGAFTEGSMNIETMETFSDSGKVRYDLVGKLAGNTNLTRALVVGILKGIRPDTFDKFKANPEEFILNASKLINEQKAMTVIESIRYVPLDDSYDTETFTSAVLRGRLGTNMMRSDRSIYDYVQYDSSTVERPFAEALENADKTVAVYAKIPVRDKGFKICTPVGNYTPDWIIAFKEGTVKHVYFVAETKGSLQSLELKGIENAKIACAKKHFESICDGEYVYDVVDSFATLLKLVK